MRVLYIAQYGEGSTSRMRGECLAAILSPAAFEVIDLDVPLKRHSRLVRSLGWHFKTGPLVADVNGYIRENMRGPYDLVWIDKGIFIEPAVIRDMNTAIRVHYTPDTAISFNQSRLFFRSIPFYDYCITTKSFELDGYREKGARNLLYCTQGYDPRFHGPYTPFNEKKGAVFIGLREEGKEKVIARLLEEKIEVTLAGAGWDKFARRHKNDPMLSYMGKGIYGEAYGRLISRHRLGLGLMSGRFPERHTTRTIEIPACGTALVGERNQDTQSIFQEDEAFLFGDIDELLEQVKRAYRDPQYLQRVTEKGYQRITCGNFDYSSLLKGVLMEINIIKRTTSGQ